jgi:oligoribonuclease NrnB/cAMP/cGMP phosphodiesterase (DHH superfamily)
MDGLAAAFIAESYFIDMEISYKCLPIQYGEDIYEVLANDMSKSFDLLFLDFSASPEIIKDLTTKFNSVTILDHHKTAEANLKELENSGIENLELVFDMNRSGAKITYDYFATSNKLHEVKRLRNMDIISDYIQDRDLWNWSLAHSKEVSEYLRYSVVPNNLESFLDLVDNFDLDEAIKIGATLLRVKDQAVASKVKKYRTITIDSEEFVCLNLTENISEVGNELCKLTNKPALMYFITDDLKVVLSFRSLDTLCDASVYAKKFGGGGHRNACGATTDLDTLQKLLKNEYHTDHTDDSDESIDLSKYPTLPGI